MTAARATVATIYNPQKQSKQALIDGFVVRKNTFKKIYDDIRKSTMKHPEQHYLIEGKRGMGKTSLLLRLAYAVEDDPSLNTWLIPLVFNEEEYSIRRLFKLWERVIELLEDKDTTFQFGESTLKRLGAQYPDDDAYERALFDWLLSELHAKGKKIILFIDNFGDLAQRFSDDEAHRLRKILQTYPDIRIVGGSAAVFELFYSYDQPFYEFFKVVRLEGLTSAETRDLLLQLSEHYKKETVRKIVKETPGRVEALRRITGGVVRSIILLFEIFADEEDGGAFRDLETILDRVTPLYKHRMDDLSTQQQAIVESIALNWDGISVKEITERTRLESKAISAQLAVLEKNGIVRKTPTAGKNHLYQIEERFFNIWYLMRLGRRADQRRVLWLVRFFEEWCVGVELSERAQKHIDAMKKGGFYPKGAYLVAEALAAIEGMDIRIRHTLLYETRSYLQSSDPELANTLSESEFELLFRICMVFFNGSKIEMNTLYSELSQSQTFKRIEKLIDESINIEDLYSEDPEQDFAMVKLVYSLGKFFQVNHDQEKVRLCFQTAAYNGHPIAMINVIDSTDELSDNKKEELFVEYAKSGNPMAIVYLVNLYADRGQNDRVLGIFQEEEFKHNDALLLLNAGQNFFFHKDKKESLDFINRTSKKTRYLGGFYLSYVSINLWNDQFEVVTEDLNQFLKNIHKIDEGALQTEFTSILLLFLAKNQTQYLYDLFTGEKGVELELKDRFKPIWYALLKKREDPEYLRMGEELRETVEEILAKVDQMAVDYA